MKARRITLYIVTADGQEFVGTCPRWADPSGWYGWAEVTMTTRTALTVNGRESICACGCGHSVPRILPVSA